MHIPSLCELFLTFRQFEYECPIVNFMKPGLLDYDTVLTDLTFINNGVNLESHSTFHVS
jgi:hypothetical protein